MSWVQAVKEYTKLNGSIVNIEPNSEQYLAIKKIQDAMNAGTYGVDPKKEIVIPDASKSIVEQSRQKKIRVSEPVATVVEEQKEIVIPCEAIRRGRPKKRVSEPVKTSTINEIKEEQVSFEGGEYSRSKRVARVSKAVPVVESKEKDVMKLITARNKRVKERLTIVNEPVVMEFN